MWVSPEDVAVGVFEREMPWNFKNMCVSGENFPTPAASDLEQTGKNIPYSCQLSFFHSRPSSHITTSHLGNKKSVKMTMSRGMITMQTVILVRAEASVGSA
jgi:hypothetical protein